MVGRATRARGVLRRGLGIVVGSVGVVLTFGVSAVVGVVLHVGIAPARRIAAFEGTRALAGTFKGRIVIEQIGGLWLDHVDGTNATVYDPDGRPVIHAEGVHANVALGSLVRALISKKGGLPIVLTDVRASHVEVTLTPNPAGVPTIAETFAPKEETPTTPAEKEAARKVWVSIPHAAIADIRVHSTLPAANGVAAELSSLTGSVLVDPVGTTVDVDGVRIVAHGLLEPDAVIDTRLSGRLALPSWSGKPLAAGAKLEGHVGAVPIAVDATYDGARVDATVDVPELDPTALRGIVPSAPLQIPARVHAVVVGTLPTLHPRIAITLGDAAVDASGVVTLGDTTQAEVTLAARRVDPRAFAPSAPAMRVTAFARAQATLGPGGKIDGRYALYTLPTALGEQAIPGLTVRGKIDRLGISGEASVSDLGLTADVGFRVSPAGKDTPIDFDAHVVAPDLRLVPPLRGQAQGAVDAHARGRLLASRAWIEADADADLTGVSYAGNGFSNGKVTAHVAGPLSAPNITTSVEADDVRVGGRQFHRATVDTRVTLGKVVTLSDTHARLILRQSMIQARAQTVKVGGGRMEVEDASVEGLGGPLRASVRLDGATRHVSAKGQDIELSRIVALFGPVEEVRGGRVALDVDVTVKGKAAQGHARVDLTNAKLRRVKNAEAHVAFDFEGTRANGQASAAVEGVGYLKLGAAGVDVHGNPLDAASWKRATGDVDIAAEIDLAALETIVPRKDNPISRSSGTLRLVGKVSRPDERTNADVLLSAWTRSLDLVGNEEVVTAAGSLRRSKETEKVIVTERAWHLSDVDAEASLRLEGKTGRTIFGGRLVDPHGPLVAVGAQADLPIAALLRDPAKAWALLQPVPITARVDIASRPIDTLPALVRPTEIRGAFGGHIEVRGTMKDPFVAVDLRGEKLTSVFMHENLPFDLAVAGTYDSKDAVARAVLTGPRGARLEATARAHAPLAAALNAAPNQPLPWEASAAVHAEQFPLEVMSGAVERGVHGLVSADVLLEHLHQDARLSASVRFGEMALGRARLQQGAAYVGFGAGKIHAAARVLGRRGSLEMMANVPAKWGSALAPSLDLQQPADLALRADNFRAAAFMPLVAGTVNNLDGNIDANTRIHLEPGFKTGSMDGDIRIRKGRVEIPAIGEEFQNIQATIRMQPWGTLRVDDVAADGITGRLTASADTRFEGLSPREAHLELNIKKEDKLPLMLEGVPLGDAWGNIKVAATSPNGRDMNVNVDAPSLHFELPRSTGHAVQPLDDEPTIRIGTQRSRGRFVLLPLGKPAEAKPEAPTATAHLRVDVHLGDNVEVKRTTELRVLLTGNPVLDVAEQARASGEIRIVSGVADVLGKRFTLDHGTITFTGDPANPSVYITAYWDAQDGTRVFADVVGPVKKIQVKLRSEPSRSQNEILALVLFGSTDAGPGSSAPPGREPSGAAQAAGYAGGIVTDAVNRALSGVTELEVTTRVDTSNAQNPRPEVGVQVARDVLVQVAYNLGLPAPGENPDRTMLIIDWRFSRKWSLSTTIGDRGSSIIDLLWQHRY